MWLQRPSGESGPGGGGLEAAEGLHHTGPQSSFNFMAGPPSTVILEPRKIKSVTVSIVSPFICHEVMRLGAMIFVS